MKCDSTLWYHIPLSLNSFIILTTSTHVSSDHTLHQKTTCPYCLLDLANAQLMIRSFLVTEVLCMYCTTQSQCIDSCIDCTNLRMRQSCRPQQQQFEQTLRING